MTPKEAIKKIQARIDTDLLNGEPFPGELEMAIEFLEKVELFRQIERERNVALAQLKELGLSLGEKTSDKYKWHDLRKNPNDLPERALSINGKRTCNESDDVMAYDGIYYYIAEYDYRREVWLDTMEYRVIRNPLAWREIEPFENDINVAINEGEE